MTYRRQAGQPLPGEGGLYLIAWRWQNNQLILEFNELLRVVFVNPSGVQLGFTGRHKQPDMLVVRKADCVRVVTQAGTQEWFDVHPDALVIGPPDRLT